MKIIYKYFSEDVLKHALTRSGHVGIKCSLPEDYNDPFELFLGVDLEQRTELLATYREVVEEIPSQLTTCFSKSPVVSPMWAHYGTNHRGFVVGFNVTQLEETYSELLIRDISYLDSPSEQLASFAEMAAFRKKPRDAMHLRNAVIYHGYFSKYSEWSYEQEVRAVNFEDYVEDVFGHKIAYVPKQCIAAIISGAKSSTETKQFLLETAAELEAAFYTAKIGRSYPTPYLLTDDEHPAVFLDGAISTPDGICEECAEPLRAKGDLCPWCKIDETDELTAAQNNPFRILDHHGLLAGYVENFPRRPRKPYE